MVQRFFHEMYWTFLEGRVYGSSSPNSKPLTLKPPKPLTPYTSRHSPDPISGPNPNDILIAEPLPLHPDA